MKCLWIPFCQLKRVPGLFVNIFRKQMSFPYGIFFILICRQSVNLSYTQIKPLRWTPHNTHLTMFRPIHMHCSKNIDKHCTAQCPRECCRRQVKKCLRQVEKVLFLKVKEVYYVPGRLTYSSTLTTLHHYSTVSTWIAMMQVVEKRSSRWQWHS